MQPSASISTALRQIADDIKKKNLPREEAIREARRALAPVLRLRHPLERSIDPATLAGRVNLALTKADMTQTDLARACGIRQPSVIKWLDGGTKSLEGKNLLRAATALNVCPLWLAVGEGPMHPAPNPAPVRPARPHRSSTTKGK